MTPAHGQLHHIELYVSDLDRSLVFWRWLLSELAYECYERWDTGESWILGSTYIVFVQVSDDFADIPYDRRGVGLNHVAFYVDTRDHVDHIAKEIAEHGSRLLYHDRYPADTYYAIYFEDPDGIKVEVVAQAE